MAFTSGSMLFTSLRQVRQTVRLASAFHLKLAGKRASKASELPLRQVKDHVSATEAPKAPKKTLVIDTRNLSVRFRGAEVALTPKCFKLLLVLARRASQVVHKETIYQSLWGHAHPDSYPYEKQIADHKGRLRKAFMEAVRHSRAISEQEISDLFVTKYGVGYQLALPQESIEIIE